MPDLHLYSKMMMMRRQKKYKEYKLSYSVIDCKRVNISWLDYTFYLESLKRITY